jgi:hypothetical protein
MKRAFSIFAVWLALAFGAWAQSPQDDQAMQAVIDAQLKAFSVDDASGAYSHAAPMIQKMFPTTGQFMAMVKQGYQPVYRNRSYSFGESFIDQLGRPAQRVVIDGTDGKQYEAVYTMERQPDGRWKIAGCYLILRPGNDV